MASAIRSGYPPRRSDSYEDNITDEFIKPILLIDEHQKPVGQIKTGDTVLFFNFRTDRPRQLTEVLSQKPQAENEMVPLSIRMLTMTQYDASFTGIETLFPEVDIRGTLGNTFLQRQDPTPGGGNRKYPHVTYFFSGGQEKSFPGEERLLIPSPKVATYDLKPEMSAVEVTAETMKYIIAHLPDFICLNFANTDMVGHTGVFSAAVKAAETVDRCFPVVPLAWKKNTA
jgi:2,3-bisphosphoglycerate-independent phosphoglycerate mutase